MTSKKRTLLKLEALESRQLLAGIAAQEPVPVCGKCGRPLRYNVPRLGPDGGYVHAETGSINCGSAITTAYLIPCSPVVTVGKPHERRPSHSKYIPNR